jgi:hypothetical protein
MLTRVRTPWWEVVRIQVPAFATEANRSHRSWSLDGYLQEPSAVEAGDSRMAMITRTEFEVTGLRAGRVVVECSSGIAKGDSGEFAQRCVVRAVTAWRTANANASCPHLAAAA